MTGFRVRPLDGTTWPDFARLVESHNGVWGGCWCMAFHPEGVARAKDAGRGGTTGPRRNVQQVPAQGVASAALEGALGEIARLGGGTVESYPEDTGGRKVSASFLHNGTLAMFESHGFERTRRIGKHHWVVTKVVLGASRRATASRRSSSTVR
jgi:hypothetical protein